MKPTTDPRSPEVVDAVCRIIENVKAQRGMPDFGEEPTLTFEHAVLLILREATDAITYELGRIATAIEKSSGQR